MKECTHEQTSFQHTNGSPIMKETCNACHATLKIYSLESYDTPQARRKEGLPPLIPEQKPCEPIANNWPEKYKRPSPASPSAPHP